MREKRRFPLPIMTKESGGDENFDAVETECEALHKIWVSVRYRKDFK